MTESYWQPDRGARPTNISEYERAISLFGGPSLALLGLSRRSLGGLALAAAGGLLFYRGLTGQCKVYRALGVSTAASQEQAGPLQVEQSIQINRPAAEIYQFWHNFENLPQFMKHLESVRTLGDGRSHWVATGPAGSTVEWDAELTEDQPNQLIAWRSLPGAQVDSAGSVRFEPAPGGRGTLVRVSFSYNPPAGVLGAAVASLFGEAPGQQVEGDLRRLRSVLEAGEVPTTAGQPAGERSALGKLISRDRQAGDELAGDTDHSLVTNASADSFPASDAPGWVGGHTGERAREVGGL